MTEEELQDKLYELKLDRIAIQVMQPMEVATFVISALYDYKFIKDIFESSYILHLDYLNLPSSRVNICFLFVCISSFACVRYAREMLREETEEISKEIREYQKVKKLTY